MPSFPPSFLHGFRLKCLEDQLQVNTAAVYSQRFGKIEHNFKEQRQVNIYSGAKTVTALAVGMAIGEGRLQPETHLIDIFPDQWDHAAPMLDLVTIRHLLQMSAGKHTFMFKTAGLNTDKDYLDLFFEEPLDAVPGTSFFYNNATTYVLSRVVEAVSGERLDHYLEERLFEPLRIKGSVWHTCPHGHTYGFSELYMTGREYAAIGRLLLDRGYAGDRELVDASFIDRMHEDTIETGGQSMPEQQAGYGYQCWLGSIPGSYRAAGMYGQYNWVSPAHQAVVTTTAHNVNHPQGILHAAKEEIFDLLDQLEA